MIDQATLQSNFIGRDNFVWWIGQIPPEESMSENFDDNENSFSYRYKVRIVGYHPDESELPNEDLPWAQVLLPTTAGSGGAQACTSVQIQQGDMVFGFFADGDNAQIPIISQVFPRNSQVSTASYSAPFQAFTGFGPSNKKNSAIVTNETNEPKGSSQPTPLNLPKDVATSSGNVSDNNGNGDTIPLADPAKNSKIAKIKSVVDDLLKQFKKLRRDLQRIRSEIRKAIDKITTLMNEYVGSFFKEIIKILRDLLKSGLKALYDLVYQLVFAATQNPVAAHKAGKTAQEAMVIPVNELEKQFSCVAGNIINQIVGQVENLIYSTLQNVEKFVTCASDHFVGSLLNIVIDKLENLMNGPLALVDKLLNLVDGKFDIGSLARGAISGLTNAAAAAFDCNQGTKNFSGLVTEWVIGGGPSNEVKSIYQNIQQISNFENSGVDINQVFDCFSGQPAPRPPTIRIFGGGPGSGAEAVPIFGNLTPAFGNTECVALGSVIGVQITNPGSGYTFPPFVEIVDESQQGYGAIARTLIDDNGQVREIYMVTEGENYCVGDIQNYSVIGVLIEDGGSGYEDGDIVTDDLGNEYKTRVLDGEIFEVTPLNNVVNSLPFLTVNTNSGTGAVLRPLLGNVKIDGEILEIVDCPK